MACPLRALSLMWSESQRPCESPRAVALADPCSTPWKQISVLCTCVYSRRAKKVPSPLLSGQQDSWRFENAELEASLQVTVIMSFSVLEGRAYLICSVLC